MDGCWRGGGGWVWLCRLLCRVGVVEELVLGVGGVFGGLGGPWCWTGEVHTSQCSALELGWESVWRKAGSISSGSVGTMWHRCSEGGHPERRAGGRCVVLIA